jgi:hypothetical protein
MMLESRLAAQITTDLRLSALLDEMYQRIEALELENKKLR